MSVADVVARQLDAYNAKNIDAFIECWAPDAEYYAHPDTLLAKGRDAIRARHRLRFQEPDLHGRLISRSVLADRVVDIEIVTRNLPEGLSEVDVVAIYEILGEYIARAWFVTGTPRPVASDP